MAKNLNDWLHWLGEEIPVVMQKTTQDFAEGLILCRGIADRMGLLTPPFKIVTVAGTNGKGSSVTLLDNIYHAAGYKTGRYMSPHVLRYNERIALNTQDVADDLICESFERINIARGDILLSYFEFGTLAALDIFHRTQVDIALLEVGLGGRLDAVNLFDPDVALITKIDLDHTKMLGSDRETIAGEKAGIFRFDQPAVCSDPEPPKAIESHAQEKSVKLNRLGIEFSYYTYENHWQWYSAKQTLHNLPLPALAGEHQVDNAAGVLQAIELLSESLPVAEVDIHQGLTTLHVPGRFQRLPGNRSIFVDIAHNPLGTRVLKKLLVKKPHAWKTHAVVGMLADKDIQGALKEIHDAIDVWHIAPVKASRSANIEVLSGYLLNLGVECVNSYPDVETAYHKALDIATPCDRLIIFGSVYTVSEVLAVTSKIQQK
ncbi:MAG: bifunctional tetrahydrofolate synthase/dihydrofolate synthase [Pseudomonadota bacterium]